MNSDNYEYVISLKDITANSICFKNFRPKGQNYGLDVDVQLSFWHQNFYSQSTSINKHGTYV